MEGDFRIGDWLVRPDLNRIEREGEEKSIEPKVMDVHVYLADHAREVLPKERIIQAVWSDAFVTDGALKYAIVEPRKALEDDPKNPRYIETIPRRGGYRLIRKVTPSEVAAPEMATVPASNQLWQQSVMVVLAAVLLLAVALVIPKNPQTEPSRISMSHLQRILILRWHMQAWLITM